MNDKATTDFIKCSSIKMVEVLVKDLVLNLGNGNYKWKCAFNTYCIDIQQTGVFNN